MANKLTAILLIFTLTSTYFSRWFVLADFELNRQFIAETLCINKGSPWLHCNGHCYLMKKLNQAQEDQSKNSQLIQKSFTTEAAVQTIFHFSTPETVVGKLIFPDRQFTLTTGASSPPFQPPKQHSQPYSPSYKHRL